MKNQRSLRYKWLGNIYLLASGSLKDDWSNNYLGEIPPQQRLTMYGVESVKP